MARLNTRTILVFILGMLTFAIGSWFLSTFIFVKRPVKQGIIEDWDQICFWQDQDGISVAISPKGCYSTSCTSAKLQTSTAVIDLQNQIIQLDAHFVLVKTSRFPLPCIENCLGGDVRFKVNDLVPNDYEVWFREDKVGKVRVFSGRPTPRQCFEKNGGISDGQQTQTPFSR
ncbi:MAG TPA: hypothetical protein VE136_09830 [Anaerolineales bacterium]|jgi:hypothetical protein|nr:hypothetical protein [Anaerolineales bacterium]